MFTLVRMLPWQRLLFEQLPALGTSWLIAELYYKWHSFSLEMLGFLATWCFFDGAIQAARRLLQSARG